MSKILKFLFCIPIVEIDVWGYRYFNSLSENDQEYVQMLIERGENVTIYSDGTYQHLYVMDLISTPGFSAPLLNY